MLEQEQFVCNCLSKSCLSLAWELAEEYNPLRAWEHSHALQQQWKVDSKGCNCWASLRKHQKYIDFPILSWSSAFNTTVEEISKVCRSEFEMESVKSTRELFLADWSRSQMSSEEILEENMLVILSSVVVPSIMLQPENLLLPRFWQTSSKNHRYTNCTKPQPVSCDQFVYWDSGLPYL